MGDYNVMHAIPWTGAYALYFFTVGMSAALFFFSTLSWFREEFVPLRRSAAYISFALLLVSGGLLIGDLAQPQRFLNAINPMYLSFASPLAWGALNLVTFGIVSVVYLAAVRDEKKAPLAVKLAVAGALLGLGLPIYTGYDLTAHQNRPVWNTPLVPVLFVGLSLVSGAAVAYFLSKGHERLIHSVRQIMLWSAGAVAAMLVSMLGTTAYGGVGSELTFMLLTQGSLGMVFLGLGVVLGTAAPLALMLAPMGRRPVGLMLAAVLLLVGGVALRYSILVGGQVLQTYF